MGSPFDDYNRLVAHVSCISDWFIQEAAGIQLDGGCDFDAVNNVALIHWILVAR